MNSRVSTRYMAQILFVVIFGFVGLGASFFILSETYTRKQATDEMLLEADRLSGLVAELPRLEMPFPAALQHDLDWIAASGEREVLLAGTQGQVLMTSASASPMQGWLLPDELLAQLRRGEPLIGGQVPELFAADQVVVAVPLRHRDRFVGAALLATPPGGISASVGNYMRVFAMSAYGVLAVTLAILYFTTERMVKPLRSMSHAARRFGQGQFDVRVEVGGDDEMAELAVAFNNMADSLAKNEEMRRSFIANVSHDLKTPMTTIAGFVDGILDGTIPVELELHYLGLVSDEVMRLSRLVNTLLDLAKFETAEVELRMGPFDLCETVSQVLISFERGIGDKRLSLNLLFGEEPITARGDADAVHRALYNIIDNAIKFTPYGGELAVIVEEHDKMAWCTVRNSGEGIPKEDLPNVFDRFFKSDRSRSLDRRGSGLGLYIAKTIVDRHGGTIRADSSEGAYAAITFSLPLYQQRSAVPGIGALTGKGREEPRSRELPTD
ncbi:MAG: HAMP domain-containing histidine kinase [Clostridiales bacterium]|nr:HAMP domain-containing histidine kinase [Clostridiales bacterium]